MGMGPLSLCRTSRDQNSKSSPVSFLNIAFLLKLPNVCFCYLHPHTLLHKIVVNPHLTDETLRLRVQDLILFNFLFVFFFNLIIYSFILAALGLHCYTQELSQAVVNRGFRACGLCTCGTGVH